MNKEQPYFSPPANFETGKAGDFRLFNFFMTVRKELVENFIVYMETVMAPGVSKDEDGNEVFTGSDDDLKLYLETLEEYKRFKFTNQTQAEYKKFQFDLENYPIDIEEAETLAKDNVGVLMYFIEDDLNLADKFFDILQSLIVSINSGNEQLITYKNSDFIKLFIPEFSITADWPELTFKMTKLQAILFYKNIQSELNIQIENFRNKKPKNITINTKENQAELDRITEFFKDALNTFSAGVVERVENSLKFSKDPEARVTDLMQNENLSKDEVYNKASGEWLLSPYQINNIPKILLELQLSLDEIRGILDGNTIPKICSLDPYNQLHYFLTGQKLPDKNLYIMTDGQYGKIMALIRDSLSYKILTIKNLVKDYENPPE